MLIASIMRSAGIAVLSLGCIFGGAVVGLILRRNLPSDHLSPESREAVKVGAGMISMMSALVLGLLVSSAKNNFDAANAALVQGGAKVILLDRVLANYGSESKEVREHLRESISGALALIWAEERPDGSLETFEQNPVMERILASILEL
jgi:hypothetical protein